MPRRSRPHVAVVVAVVALASFVAAGCGDGGPSGAKPTRHAMATGAGSSSRPPRIALVQVGRFQQPVDAVAVPGTDLLAVVEKVGRVRLVAGMSCARRSACPRRPITTGHVVVDMTGKVATGQEQGLLGVAFHPDWPTDPRVFLDYTDVRGDTHVEAWRLDGPAGTAKLDRQLLQVDQPFPNHNGGHLAFGPDGLLYIGMGDGGDAGDPGDRAQRVDERLGKLLRLDVDHGGERGFAIPRGNLKKGAPEAWALGLRNPWRFSFDRKTGDLWIGDVGQDEFEELDALTAKQVAEVRAPNFGWRRREGFSAYDGSGTDGGGTRIAPVLDYGHDHGCSITGGVVYRGQLLPKLRGWYLFADFCAHDLRLLRADGVPGSARRRGELAWSTAHGAAQVASFGEDAHGEVLVVSLDGAIRQVVPA
jgi:glucose/arabinose dehydrogenase